MALMLLPMRLTGSLLRTQSLSLTALVERQLGHSISSVRRLQSTAAISHSSILGQLHRPQIAFSTSILQQCRTNVTPRTIRRDRLHTIRQTSIPPARATTPSRNTASLASPPPAEDDSGQAPSPTRPIVAYHLFLCAAMVYLIIVVGGLTRLTESGLSITEWNPGFKGMKLPWTDAEWDAEWEKYKGTPEWAM
jgi:hypothetical protein